LTDAIDIWITAAALIAGGALVGFMAWLERRPRKSLDPPLLPTTPFLLAGGLVIILAIVHLVNLLGVHTGR